MDNFHEPRFAVITPSQVHLVALKLWYATGGLYIWEFFTTLDYEWGVIRGRLPYRWTIWIYTLARVAALLGVILCIAIVDITTPINCQLWTLFSVFLFCLSATASSLLIVLRTIAIWNRHKAVLALAITLLGVNIALHLQNLVRLRSVWVPAHLACETIKADPSLFAFIPLFSDMVLLLFVLSGLLVMRRRDGATFGLTRLLWKQGVIWLILGSAVDVIPLVLTLLHLNDPMRGMFEAPGVIIMTIAATRMHRSLVSSAPDVMHENPQSSLAFAKTNQTDASSTVPDRVEVVELTMHKAFGQHSTGSTSGGDSATNFSTSEQMPLGDSPKLSLAPESTWPLPAVSSSHSILQAQGVAV